MKWHPYAETFPLLEGDEYVRLKEDIRTNGLREKVKYRMVNGEKEYLDGRNRVQACKDLRISWREELVKVADHKVEESIDSLNFHRRHLKKEQQDACILALRQRGDSTRQIGERVGVRDATVRRRLADIEAGASSSTASNVAVDTVVGKDGKRRKAKTGPRKVSVPPAESNGMRELGDDTEIEEAAAKEQWVDAEGEPVPPKATLAFEKAKEIAAIYWQLGNIASKLDTFAKQVSALAAGPGGRLIIPQVVVPHLVGTASVLARALRCASHSTTAPVSSTSPHTPSTSFARKLRPCVVGAAGGEDVAAEGVILSAYLDCTRFS